MTKHELAIEIASALFGKRVGADNWKVRNLRKRSKKDLEDLCHMAKKACPTVVKSECCGSAVEFNHATGDDVCGLCRDRVESKKPSHLKWAEAARDAKRFN